LEQSLDAFAIEQQQTVRTALFQALAEMIALTMAILMFVGTLAWSSRKQRELSLMQQRNDELARGQQLEHERSSILEMTGRNEPLPAILRVLVSLVERQIPGVVTCV